MNLSNLEPGSLSARLYGCKCPEFNANMAKETGAYLPDLTSCPIHKLKWPPRETVGAKVWET